MSHPAHAKRCFSSHSPTLRPWIARHSRDAGVLRGGVLEPEPPALFLRNRRLKQTLISSAISQAEAQRVFLSQAGPRFVLDLLQAGHHPRLFASCFASETTKATRLGRPRWSCYAASYLAHTPRGEGSAVTDRTDVLHGLLPMETRRRGTGRFGKQVLGVDSGQHGRVSMPHRRIDQT
jgi:hypothetical protein